MATIRTLQLNITESPKSKEITKLDCESKKNSYINSYGQFNKNRLKAAMNGMENM